MGLKTNEYGLTEEDLADIVEYFELYMLEEPPAGTVREDLPIASNTLDMVLSDMGFLLTEAELISLQSQLDPEGKGHICLDAFVATAAGPLFARTRLTEENAQTTFQIFDADDDGLIRESDIRDVMSLFGDSVRTQYIKDMIAEVDMDGDKAIGVDEFKYFIAGEVF